MTTVTFTATASDADGDAMSYTWFFGGRRERERHGPRGRHRRRRPTSTTPDSLYSDLPGGERRAGDHGVRPASACQVGDAAELPVSSGLVLNLQSDIKIGLEGSTVTAWLDGSGKRQQPLRPRGPAARAGRHAHRAGGHRVRRLGRPPWSGGTTPTGSSTCPRARPTGRCSPWWTTSRRSARWPGVVYGDAATNEAFGIRRQQGRPAHRAGLRQRQGLRLGRERHVGRLPRAVRRCSRATRPSTTATAC